MEFPNTTLNGAVFTSENFPKLAVLGSALVQVFLTLLSIAVLQIFPVPSSASSLLKSLTPSDAFTALQLDLGIEILLSALISFAIINYLIPYLLKNYDTPRISFPTLLLGFAIWKTSLRFRNNEALVCRLEKDGMLKCLGWRDAWITDADAEIQLLEGIKGEAKVTKQAVQSLKKRWNHERVVSGIVAVASIFAHLFWM
jgi:hypothetical protein